MILYRAAFCVEAMRQTIAGNFMKRANSLPEPEERLFQIEQDVQILCHCHWQPERQKRLTLMIVHGLEGSSNSRYVIGTGSRAWARGWNVVRMNIRGCGGTEHLSSTLYHSGLSQDVEKLVAGMIASDGLRRVALAGFSMGGNQVLRAVGQWGTNTPPELIAAATVSPACDLAISSDRIHAAANSIYEWWFLISLRRSFRRKSELWPGRYDPALLKNVHSVRDFDEHITARYMGFAGAADYYDKASSSHVLDRIADSDTGDSFRRRSVRGDVSGEPTQADGKSECNISPHQAWRTLRIHRRAKRGWPRRWALGRTQDRGISGASGSRGSSLIWMRITAWNSVLRHPRWSFPGKIRRGGCTTLSCAPSLTQSSTYRRRCNSLPCGASCLW